MRAVQKRDNEAYSMLLSRHIKGLHAYAFRFCQNENDAEDIVQETFLRVWKQSGSWQPKGVQFSTWLYRIAHNLCIDAYRKYRPTHQQSEEVLLNQTSSTKSDIDTSPESSIEPSQEQALEKDRQLTLLRNAVYNLPNNQRDAILLCSLQGFSNIQAAEILQVSTTALESLLARGRVLLKKTITLQSKQQNAHHIRARQTDRGTLT